MRICLFIAGLLAGQAAVPLPAFAVARMDRLAVSAVVEGACGIAVPRLVEQLRGPRDRRAPVCTGTTPGMAPLPQPVVAFGWDAEMGSDMLLIEF